MDKLTLEQRRTLRYSCYNIAIKKLKELVPNPWAALYASKQDSDDIAEAKRLVKQFYYGIAAQNELLDLCIKLKWIEV